VITPVEIRQHTFKKSLRGYDTDEVNAFLGALASEWERTLDQHRALREELSHIQMRYDGLKEVEGMLHKTLQQAEQTSKSSLENAKEKAELRLRDAETRAQEIVRKGIEERQRLDQEVQELSARKDELLMQLKLFLSTQMERLRALESQELPIDTAAQFTKKLTQPSPADTVVESLFGAKESSGMRKGLFDEIVREL